MSIVRKDTYMYDPASAQPSGYFCSCGRAWQVSACAPTNRPENVVCRCGVLIARSSDGSLSALLISPRERFGHLRKLRYLFGLHLLQTATILKIKLGPNSWIRPHRIIGFRHTNTAIRAYFRFESNSDVRAKK
jgi:hypothetical protein